VENKAPAFAVTWLKDFQAVQDLKIPAPPVATPPNTQKLLEALIHELTLAIPYAPKKLKKEMVYKGKNNRVSCAKYKRYVSLSLSANAINAIELPQVAHVPSIAWVG
jgi:hypothetical protein